MSFKTPFGKGCGAFFTTQRMFKINRTKTQFQCSWQAYRLMNYAVFKRVCVVLLCPQAYKTQLRLSNNSVVKTLSKHKEGIRKCFHFNYPISFMKLSEVASAHYDQCSCFVASDTFFQPNIIK